MLTRRALCAALAAAPFISAAYADDYPSRPIRIISPFPAGSASDTVARIVLDQVSQTLGQPMVVEARPGAGGIVGFADVAKADPDGYTIVTSSTSMGTGEVLHSKLPYDPAKDFASWNNRAGGRAIPKVAAIVMTMVGSKSQQRATPDRASRMYIERALAIAEKYPQLFDHAEPADAFVITDDFVSSGRISGAKSIPIAKLNVGSFHLVEGKRLQVNSSAQRYQRELAHLVSIL